MKEEIDSWKRETGISTITSGDVSEISYILNATTKEIVSSSPDRVSEIVIALSNYYIYIGYQSGLIAARVQFLSEELEIKTSAAAAGISSPSVKERNALAITRDSSLAELHRRLSVEKAKLEIIKPVVEAVRQKMYILGRYVDRKKEAYEH